MYIKVQQVKESNRGETEFPYKNCPPKRKDKTIKNRKLIHNYTSRDAKRKKNKQKQKKKKLNKVLSC